VLNFPRITPQMSEADFRRAVIEALALIEKADKANAKTDATPTGTFGTLAAANAPLAVSLGGTGADNATAARSNLNAAALSHSHAIADTTGLQSALDGKAALSHNHTASEVTDFAEAVDDRVAALLTAGTNITLTYNDGAGTLTIDASGGGATDFTDLGDVPASYTGQSLRAVRVNAGETALEFFTLSGGGDLLAANNLSDLASASTALTNLGLSANGKSLVTAADYAAMRGLLAFTSADLSDFAEAVDDRVAALLVAGAGITLTYNDGAGTLTVDATAATPALVLISEVTTSGSQAPVLRRATATWRCMSGAARLVCAT
jgi:hypothetical protein